MTIQYAINRLEELAPLAYAEEYDNVGLLCGDATRELSGILVAHDALESVIEEAIANHCNLVVCFHPIVFSGIKKFRPDNYVNRALIKAIRHDIAIFALHTAFDNHREGVNKILCDALGLKNPKILVPRKSFIRKLITFAPTTSADEVREALFAAGAGNIGNYDRCSFNSPGTGTFRGNECSDPVIGEIGKDEAVSETKIEVTFEKHKQSALLRALFKAHPYEEVAYEIYALENLHQHIGLGMIGELEHDLDENAFLSHVKSRLECGGIRHSALLGKPVRKVAVLGGSGSFAIADAIKAGADAFVTADLKYHQFYEAEGRLLLLDVGHYESERFTKNRIVEFLIEKIPNFAIILSKQNTNPVKYF